MLKNRKTAKAKPKASVKRKSSSSRPKVENIMTHNVSIPIPDSTTTSRKTGAGKKKSKGFVQTVKDDVRATMKAVGVLVQKVGLDVPPPKRRNTKANIVPPFTSPI